VNRTDVTHKLDSRPLIAHMMYRFDVGGLENGVANLINRMPSEHYRHAIIALTEVTDFKRRIRRDDVEFIALGKQPGHLISDYPRLFRLFRELRPAILHTRNLAALEAVVPAWAAGVPVRIQSEHGRDVGDLDGSNRKYQWARRLYNPFVTHWVALSRDLEQYLVQRVGVTPRKVAQIYNGVDIDRFDLADKTVAVVEGCPFRRPDHWLVGTVGRMQPVKDQMLLARAFIRLLELRPALRERVRLVMIGEGPLLELARGELEKAGVADLAWLPGERHDVADILRQLDCFVLPSLAEGVSNTILEAMASGLPVIATRVGGNAELVVDGMTGRLVPAADTEAMARAIAEFADEPARAAEAGRNGRIEVQRRFSMDAMEAAYRGLYDRLLFESAGSGWRQRREH
jgi:sugar transferase (PEP-CTERM/EpsH1 system associated)